MWKQHKKFNFGHQAIQWQTESPASVYMPWDGNGKVDCCREDKLYLFQGFEWSLITLIVVM